MLITSNGQLTQGGRLLRSALILATVVAGVAIGTRAWASSDEETTSPAPFADTYTVAPGDTLWGIASRLTPDGRSTRETVAQIRDLNGMDSAALRAGEQILVPISG